MTRIRVVCAAAVLLLACLALSLPHAFAQTSPAPSPSASGATASPSASPSASASPAATTEALAVLLSAEPRRVAMGDETVLVAQVTNTGSAALPSVSLTVTVPDELELVSSFPKGSSAGAEHTIPLGPLDPGDSAVAQVTLRGLTLAPAAVVGAVASGGTATASASTPVEVVAEGGGGEPGALKVTSRAREVLTQVGSMLQYEVTVSNEGDQDLENVLVVDVAPQEIAVVSVDIVDEVEAVQIGDSAGRHDIVWNVGSLPAGASVTLPWDGRAVRAGDLRAVNSVRGLLGTDEATRSTSESFLASEGPRDVENPHFEPITERVVTFVDPPPGDPAAHAATQPTVVLPLTGVSITKLALGGALLVFGGLLLVVGARLAPRASRKAIAATMLVGLVGAACVSGGDGGSVTGARGATPRTFGTDDPRDDEETRVKGERIVRGEDEDGDAAATPAPQTPAPQTAAPATPAPTSTPVPPAAATATPPPVVAAPATAAAPTAAPEPLRVVRVVETTLEDLPVVTQASRAGDNTISFGWDEAAGGITAASSGTRFVRGSGSDLHTDLTVEDGSIVNRITLRNTADEARLRVRGRLVHEVYDGTSLVARLRSEPVDVVLAPGGEVVARFSYLVPTGDYTIQAAFEASP